MLCTDDHTAQTGWEVHSLRKTISRGQGHGCKHRSIDVADGLRSCRSDLWYQQRHYKRLECGADTPAGDRE